MNWYFLQKFAISENYIQEVYKALADKPEETGLINIFGDKTRVVIPFTSISLRVIQKRLEKLGYEVDLKNGITIKNVMTQRGPKPREEKLGKVILRELGQEWLKSYSESGAFSIILSKSPIDVLRMSDFKNIQSCHSEGGEYFHCALSEAKNSGAIAYLVKTSDLQNIDLEEDEIFSDKRRNIQGIVPIARLRIRRFINKKDKNQDLGLPEQRIYGNKSEGFLDSVKDYLKQSQEKIIKKRPRMKEYMLAGGSYQDTNAAQIFNSFFEDKLDSGVIELRDSDDNLTEIWEAEILQYLQDAERLHYFNIYASVENDGHGETPYVYCSANISVKIPENMIINEAAFNEDNASKRKGYSVRRFFEDNLENCTNNITISDIDLDKIIHDRLVVFDVVIDDVNTPDDVKSQIDYFLNFEEKEYESFKNCVLQFLFNNNYILANKEVQKEISNISNQTFKNLKVLEEDEKINIEINLPSYNLYYPDDYKFEETKREIADFISTKINQIDKMSYLFDIEKPLFYNLDWNNYNVFFRTQIIKRKDANNFWQDLINADENIVTSISGDQKVVFNIYKIVFSIDYFTDEEVLKHTLSVLHLIDQNFQSFVKEILNIIDQNFEKYEQ